MTFSQDSLSRISTFLFETQHQKATTTSVMTLRAVQKQDGGKHRNLTATPGPGAPP